MKKALSGRRPAAQKRRLALSAIELAALFLLLCAAFSAAWFSSPDAEKHGAAFTDGRVRFTLKGEAADVFVRRFEVEDEDYEDDDEEIEVYIPAVKAEIALNTASPVPVTAADLQQGATLKLQALTYPDNATDKITWRSSDESVLTVSRYGRVKAVGEPGQRAEIFMTAVDRTPGSTRPDLVVGITVTITDRTGGGEDDSLAFLPAGVQFLKSPPLSFINRSTVRTKLRLVVTWTYSPLDPASDDEYVAGRKPYPVSELLAGLPAADWKTHPNAPLLLDVAGEGTGASKIPHWQAVEADRGMGTLILTDAAGIQWSVTELCLTDAEKTGLSDRLAAGTLPLTAVNQARAVLCYGTSPADWTADYGDVLEPPVFTYEADGVTPTQASLDAATLPVLDGLTASDSYTAYSVLKRFSVKLELQARQADYFVLGQGNGAAGDGWFDVYTCDWDSSAGEAHAAHGGG